MIVVPCGGDQYDNAARIERLAAGFTISRKRFDQRSAAVALKRLLQDADYGKRAAELGERVRAEDGVRAAADAIEQQLA